MDFIICRIISIVIFVIILESSKQAIISIITHLMFHHNEDRSNLISEHVSIGSGSQPLSRHAHDIQTLGELVEEVRMTSLHLVPQRSPAVSNNLVKTETSVRKREVHGLGDLRRMVKVKNIGISIIGLVDKVQQYLHHSIQELVSQLSCFRSTGDGENVFVTPASNIKLLLLQEVSNRGLDKLQRFLACRL